MKFDYVKFDAQSEEIQAHFKAMYDGILILADSIKDGRSKNYLVAKLEESYMWVGKGIRADQLEREKI